MKKLKQFDLCDQGHILIWSHQFMSHYTVLISFLPNFDLILKYQESAHEETETV